MVDKLVERNLLLHREADISPFLASISPVLSGQKEELVLSGVSISSRGVGVLVHSLTSPHCHLHKLRLLECTISSNDYCHLTTAIANSNLTQFTSSSLSIDVAAGKALARALTQSKTLEEVTVVERPSMDIEVAKALVEAMNHSSVEKLRIGENCKQAVSECSFPTGRVEIDGGLLQTADDVERKPVPMIVRGKAYVHVSGCFHLICISYNTSARDVAGL